MDPRSKNQSLPCEIDEVKSEVTKSDIRMEDAPFQCPEKYDDRTNSEDVETRHQEITCTECLEICSSEKDLEQHKCIHTRRSFECKNCLRKYFIKNSLNHHMQRCMKEKRFECNSCNKKFYTESEVKIHGRSHVVESPSKCEKCGKGYRTKKYLRKHMAICAGKSPLECERCFRVFKEESHLTMHMRKYCKVFECPYCSKKVNGKRTLTKHINRHLKNHKAIDG